MKTTYIEFIVPGEMTVFGCDGFSRTKKMLKGLDIDLTATQYKAYEAFLENAGFSAISLKQAAIDIDVRYPMKGMMTKSKGLYERPNYTLAELFIDGPIIAVEAHLKREQFIEDRVAPVNESKDDTLGYYIAALSSVTDKKFSLRYETNIEEKPDKEKNHFYYEPMQRLFIRSGNKESLVL